MSRYFWPMKLAQKPKLRTSAIAGGKLMSSKVGVATLCPRGVDRPGQCKRRAGGCAPFGFVRLRHECLTRRQKARRLPGAP